MLNGKKGNERVRKNGGFFFPRSSRGGRARGEVVTSHCARRGRKPPSHPPISQPLAAARLELISTTAEMGGCAKGRRRARRWRSDGDGVFHHRRRESSCIEKIEFAVVIGGVFWFR